MIKFFKEFAADDSGATAIEYGLIVALIAVVVIGVFSTIGENMNGKMNRVGNAMS